MVESMPHRPVVPAPGSTVLHVTVPEAEPLVGAWRERYDRAAGLGVPAHVTVIAPFLPTERLDAGALAELAALIAEHPPFEMRFADFGRFSQVLYLAPEPAAPLLALTEAMLARWPEAPPYGGEFDVIVPHLTLAEREEPATYREVTDAVRPLLPFTSKAGEVQLMAFDGTRFREHTAFPLQG
jgi:2'-5' RNA ligase